ncbi:hypothetical protein CHLRE_11g469650v5 [Chlamydomonas reinhardtii]|uniref:Uncharacterized protein n=1 Tax=Chlamydomonas reinhardtii TaxID=3055 RepID=A0A2K3D887_CHLRE|nr:uncharacterized protein CHLRE_11g469650v5 [Chlamydomonas reinhardtii]PNW76747.1 hypothetical protein CHLRE_11g469650v5 [Chlamydomonas reinhardtii]
MEPGNADLPYFLDSIVADFLRLLHAVDTFPRGGLYSGYYAIQAAQRYERYWTAVLRVQPMGKGSAAILPPLDVAYAWLVHRQDPAGYKSAMTALGVAKPHPASAEQAFGFSIDCADRTEWKKVAGEHPQWPPPAPGSSYGVESECRTCTSSFRNAAVDLANAMVHFSRLLHTWMRPHFLDSAFLQRAWGRFSKFLRLHIAYPQEVLVPAADIALIWHTYLGLSDKYAEMWVLMFKRLQKDSPLQQLPAELWRPDYLALSPDMRAEAYGRTAVLYQQMYGEPYNDPDTAWIAPEVPYPLAAPYSPIAPLLQALEDAPKPSAHYLGTERAETLFGKGQSWASAKVPRAGAHALYLAWLMSSRAEHYYDNAGYQRCCLPRKIVHTKALSTAVAAVVSCAYFLDLPATSKHPYLRCINVSNRQWKPPYSATAAAASSSFAAGQQPPQPPPPSPQSSQALQQQPIAGGGFSPTDVELLLRPSSQEHLLIGLNQLLQLDGGGGSSSGGKGGGNGGGGKDGGGGSGAAGARGSVALLWSILGDKAAAYLAQLLFKGAWQRAIATSVGHMQREYAHKKFNARDRDCVHYYGTTDYYHAGMLYYMYGADGYAFDDPRRNQFDGSIMAVGGGDGGGGGGGGGWGGGWGGGGGGDGGGGSGCGGGGGGGGCGGGCGGGG